MVGNKCTFWCKGCNKAFTSLKSHRFHNYRLTKEGLPPCSIDGPNWLNFVEKAVAHCCRLCSKLLLCDKEHIYRHMNSQHKIKVSIYMKEYLSQETAPESVEVQALKRETPIVTSKFDHYTVSPYSLPREKVTNVVENLCTFKCMCSATIKSYNSLLGHSKKCKELTKRVSLKTAAEFVDEARYHCCRVCARRILCDKGLILRHVHASHSHLGIEGYSQLAGVRHIALEMDAKATDKARQFADLQRKVPKIAPHKSKMTA